MKKVVFIYDNSIDTNDRVKTIIGKNKIGEMVVKRKTLYTIFEELCNDISCIEFIKIDNKDDFSKTLNYPKDYNYFYYSSSFGVINYDEFKIILDKSKYVNDNTIVVSHGNKAGCILSSRDSFEEFIKDYNIIGDLRFLKYKSIDTDALIDLTIYQNLLMYISSGFDARYFNTLEGDNYTVTKKSKDKHKMKMEYSFYWLLPERMKNWMVMPFDYQEKNDYASYTMERLSMTDIAIRWTHGAIDENEFRCILDKVFYFFNIRDQKLIDKEKYENKRNELYINKVIDRIERLKKEKEYPIIADFIKNGTEFESIDSIITVYKELYTKIASKKMKKEDYKSVIGHGDVFFANMLYSKEINMLRLIDPKGALSYDDLWTDPYYDIAKLSHSICGNYDFFNTGSYDINVNKNMKMELNIHFDNEKYKKIFKGYLKNNNFEYNLVRIYEVSLFLSMLPLHIDNPHKVMGFILNAINIIKEIDENV